MKKRLTLLAALALVVSLVPMAWALDFSKQEMSRLAAGKTVKKRLPNSRQNGFYGGTGFILVDAPADEIWKMLMDWKVYPSAFPHTVEAKELKRRGNRSLVRMRLGYKLLSVKYHVSVMHDEEGLTISFELDESRPHDITATRGYWKLFPQPDGRTLVVYAVSVQVPPGIVAFLGDKLEKSLERNLIGLPYYVKQFFDSQRSTPRSQMTAAR